MRRLDTEGILALADPDRWATSDSYFVEGARFIHAAAKARAPAVAMVLCEEMAADWVRQCALREAGRLRIETFRVSAEQFRLLSRVSEPQGVGMVLRKHWARLGDQRAGAGDTWLAVDNIRSPGNLGTLLRTAEAVDARGLFLIGGETDPYHPACVRATMGALFSMRFVRTTAHALRRWKSRERCLVVGATPSTRTDYRSLNYRSPVVLMLGSEREGLGPAQIHLCDRLVRIPMSGPTDSLNLAVAGSLMLYEIYNQRHAPDR